MDNNITTCVECAREIERQGHSSPNHPHILVSRKDIHGVVKNIPFCESLKIDHLDTWEAAHSVLGYVPAVYTVVRLTTVKE